MSDNHHTPYAVGAELAASVMNVPTGQLDQTITNILDGSNQFTKARIGSGTPEASAVLQMDSTTQGFLPPRMSTAQRDAISSPADGLLIWNETTNALNYYDGAWRVVGNVGGAMTELIAPTALSGSTGVSLTALSQSYQDLILRLRIRSNAAAENDALAIRFNNDSGGSNYAWTQLYSNTAATIINDTADDAVDIRTPAANATANRFLEVSIRLFNYTETGELFGTYEGVLADDVFYATWGAFSWVGGAALNRIDFDVIAGTAFDGIYSLYGMGTN